MRGQLSGTDPHSIRATPSRTIAEQYVRSSFIHRSTPASGASRRITATNSSDGISWDGSETMPLRTDASIGPSATVGRAAPTGMAGPDEDAGLGGEGDAAGEACACRDCGGADPDGGAVVHEVTASSASPYPAPRAKSLRPCLLSPIPVRAITFGASFEAIM
ncbi:hypothetical protein AB0F18_38615 [Streptomyces sp. NPDC029216]|uniref:hypothetical protein n=1 Tax=Streptomyces sp. NPDC029216 TaxID=3154701 RepID=UPI0033D61675